MTTPPRLATWLLARLGVSKAKESLLGDLIEEYQYRGSDWWYWRQVMTAILVGVFQDLRTHKLLVLKMVYAGWASAYLTSMVASRVLFGQRLRPSDLRWGPDHGAASMVFIMLCVCAAVSGWVVARFYSEHRTPMLLGYVGISLVLVVLALPWNCQIVSRDLFLSILPFHIAYGFFGMPFSILLGAAFGTKRSV